MGNLKDFEREPVREIRSRSQRRKNQERPISVVPAGEHQSSGELDNSVTSPTNCTDVTSKSGSLRLR